MEKSLKIISLLFLFLFIKDSLFAQREIFGKILTTENESIPNVVVKLKGKEISTISDKNGNYKIWIPEDTIKIVEFSNFDGMIIKEVKFISKNEINIILTYQDDLNFYLDLSLEELMNIEIFTVSKNVEKISEAPAIVTVITEEQIKNYGVQTLTELMSYVPGFSVSDNYFKRQMITSRGSKMTLYNDKILMLINGIPAYDAAALEYFLDVIPIPSIKQIEIIRGPGSTLYGTNAFSAVINILTKNGDEDNKLFAYISGGSFGTRETGIAFGDNYKDFSFHISAVMKNNDGYKKEGVVDENGEISDIVYEHDNNNILLNLKYKNFQIYMGYMFQKWTKFGSIPAFFFNLGKGELVFNDKYFTNLIFDKNINEDINLKINYRFDWADKQAEWGSLPFILYQNVLGLIDTTTPPDYYRNRAYLNQIETNFSYNINKKINLMLGFSYENRTTKNLADIFSDLDGDFIYSNSTKETPFSVNDFGGFFQMNGKLGKIGYIAGLRASYLYIDKKTYLTPRIGLVYNLSASSSFKILYGESFRGAGAQEQYYKIPNIIYGAEVIEKQLKPEQIRSYEFAIDQSITQEYKLRLNAFYNNIYDIITRRAGTNEEKEKYEMVNMVYDNIGEQYIYGGEFEFIGQPTENINFWANFSYKDGKVDKNLHFFYDQIISYKQDTSVTFSGGKEENFIPYMEKIIANAGFSYKIKNINISPNFQYMGKKKGYFNNKITEIKNNITYDYTIKTISEIEDYFLFNLFINYKLNEKMDLSLSIRNIFDKTYYYPEDVRKNLIKIPGGPRRNFYLKLSYKI